MDYWLDNDNVHATFPGTAMHKVFIHVSHDV